MLQDVVNKKVWKNTRGYTDAEGFTDDGEKAAYSAIAEQVRGQPILDLGVGGGRSIPLFTALTRDYVAIDYSPEMVAGAKRRFPQVDVRQGDARDLSAFGDGTLGLVAFSFNGIDCVDRDGRRRVMEEARRVLRPGGIFWFSTLNKDGPGRRMRPWIPELELKPSWAWLGVPRALLRTPRRVYNYFSNRELWRDGGDWCLAPLSAHDYRLVVHFTTLQATLNELRAAGFNAEPDVFECSFGRRVTLADELSGVFWFHVLARR